MTVTYYVDEVNGGRCPEADGTEKRPFRSVSGAIYAGAAARAEMVIVKVLRRK